MRAVEMSEFGPPQVLVPVEMLDPVAGTGQVVVAVAFASITFVETQVRAGKAPNPAMMPVLPVVPGNGVGGVVIQVGEGVSPALLGARVVTSTGGSGGYAERVAVPGAGLIPVPDDLRLDDAVALLADGRTAALLIRAAAVRSGDVVLVEAAAGGVGSLLIQLARNAGARVVAAAGTPQKLELARELGADFAVNYREPHWADRVRTEVNAVDVVFDGVGGEIGREAFTLLSPSGRFSPYGMASGSFADISQGDADQRGVAVIRGGPLTPEQMLELARFALGEGAAGRLRPVIGQRFPLERAADAHAAIAARSVIGKTLLVITPTPFTPTERDYLATQTLGRLATVQPDGTLQVSPVGFQYNGGTATIDIRGYTSIFAVTLWRLAGSSTMSPATVGSHSWLTTSPPGSPGASAVSKSAGTRRRSTPRPMR